MLSLSEFFDNAIISWGSSSKVVRKVRNCCGIILSSQARFPGRSYTYSNIIAFRLISFFGGYHGQVASGDYLVPDLVGWYDHYEFYSSKTILSSDASMHNASIDVGNMFPVSHKVGFAIPMAMEPPSKKWLHSRILQPSYCVNDLTTSLLFGTICGTLYLFQPRAVKDIDLSHVCSPFDRSNLPSPTAVSDLQFTLNNQFDGMSRTWAAPMASRSALEVWLDGVIFIRSSHPEVLTAWTL